MSTDSAVVPTGIKFTSPSGSITHALEMATGVAPHSALKTANAASDSTIAIDVGGATKYIPVYDSAA